MKNRTKWTHESKVVAITKIGKTITLKTGIFRELEAGREFDGIEREAVDYYPADQLESITSALVKMGGKRKYPV